MQGQSNIVLDGKPVSIHPRTRNRLLRVQAVMQTERGHRVTADEAVAALLDWWVESLSLEDLIDG